MTPKFIQLLEKCVADGIVLGHNRAYKHSDAPERDRINEQIFSAIFQEIYEWFDTEENT